MDSIATLRPAAEPARGASLVDAGVTLTIVAHPDPSRVGEMAAVEFGADRRVALSRREPSFSGPGGPPRPLEDPHLSRSPLYLSFEAGDFPVWADPGTAPSVVRSLHGPRNRAWYVALAGRVGLLIEPGLRAPAPREGHGLIGVSTATERVREQIAMAAASELPVLLLGETGTGKELAALAIHAASARHKGPLVAVNLSAIPESTAASQLFGHVRGAFTDAAQAHDGYFVQASGGTLFLDEIGEAAVPLQVQLLRALEQQEIQPIGGRVRGVDVRVLAATDTDLDAAVASGRFRQALLFRLRGLTLRMQPLRERPADVAVQLVHFLARSLDTLGQGERLHLRSWHDAPWLDLAAVEAALIARWPGNSRELRATAGQAALVHATDPHVQLVTGESTAPPIPSDSAVRRAAGTAGSPADAATRLSESAVRDALALHNHSVRGAARALQVAPNTLYARMNELGIRRAGDLSDDALAAAKAATGGDLEAMARHLGVSLRGLQRRLGRGD
ncbi:sigma 54-interacting transcriptional regulator [Nannocystis sp.]|uniref:sigma 54-interacting transcriptional regulator n=1 Tax=Nannocystis sp. TaxID=1962667 RepID=UPI002427E36F|nr:sigma 54-interacting transcriptional regulator [Nannocystis sp.]MBK7827553.1 sigma-54-dependent Fis family transcriptional regulator [Nannocystis sp.]MBK9756433.1 sigma-54-dependent Fis family transcriptional regulator [Nannocystis sp.]